MMTVWKMNSKVLASPKLKREVEMCDASRTMAMFTKLFPTRMEARSCSGLESSFSMSCAERFLFDLSDSISLGSSEKRATSEPEIRAESPSSNTNTRSPERALTVKGKNSMFPNKAPTEVKKLVSKLIRLMIKTEGHQEFPPVRYNRQMAVVPALCVSLLRLDQEECCCCWPCGRAT